MLIDRPESKPPRRKDFLIPPGAFYDLASACGVNFDVPIVRDNLSLTGRPHSRDPLDSRMSML